MKTLLWVLDAIISLPDHGTIDPEILWIAHFY